MNRVLEKLIYFIATMGDIGYFPASGTVASIITWLFLYYTQPSHEFMYCVIFFGTIVGIMCSAYIERTSKSKDPSYIVIDEMIGVCIAFAFVPPIFSYQLISLILFRFFDITKIVFISKAEKIPHGIGVMLDDIIAACYSVVIIRLFINYF